MNTDLHKGKLFIISGPSGTGKGTICNRLKELVDIDVSVSMTTRQPRNGEVDGISYYFVTKEEFRNEIDNGGLLEYAEVYENYYGTPKQKVLEKLEQGRDVILEIDTQGALNVKKNYPDGVSIFILPPSLSLLRERLVGRGTETEEAVNMRLSKTLSEISLMDKYDYYVINDEVEAATNRVISIISAEHSKVAMDIYDLIEKY